MQGLRLGIYVKLHKCVYVEDIFKNKFKINLWKCSLYSN